MRVSDFDFDLPEDLIALRPASPRDAARLLVIDGVAQTDAQIRDLPKFLKRGDLLVVNDTRVIPARLFATRPSRAGGVAVNIEIMLNRRTGAARYDAFSRPAKRLKVSDALEFSAAFSARVLERGEGGMVTLEFDREGEALDRAIERAGETPLPPYIAGRRAADAQDTSDYQTVYANEPGAVAAPTAGLHFTPELFTTLEAQGIARLALTLHVGAGTFLPVSVDDTRDHVMHAEWGRITSEAAAIIARTRAQGGRIVAVGTTSLRLLESAADASGRINPFEGETRIFIKPGDPIRGADLLLTNFHLPRSTLIMLVQAFGGVEPMRAAYAHAIASRYRFYSYGDACLIHRQRS